MDFVGEKNQWGVENGSRGGGVGCVHFCTWTFGGVGLVHVGDRWTVCRSQK